MSTLPVYPYCTTENVLIRNYDDYHLGIMLLNQRANKNNQRTKLLHQRLGSSTCFDLQCFPKIGTFCDLNMWVTLTGTKHLPVQRLISTGNKKDKSEY